MHRSAVIFAAGVFSLVAQTVLLRELFVAFHGNELGTGVFFASWLVWVAVGAIGARALGGRLPEDREQTLAWLALAYLPAVGLQLAGFQELRTLAGIPLAEVFPLERLVPLAVVLLAPSSLLTGALFHLASEDREPSRLYAWEAAGSFLGGSAFTAAVLAGFPPLAVLGAAAGVLCLSVLSKERIGAILGLVVCAGLMAGAGPIERFLAEVQLARLLPEAELLAARDTASGRHGVAKLGSQLVALRDGKVTASWPDEIDAPTEAAIVVAQANGPSRVLVLGDHGDELVRALLAHDGIEAMQLVIGDRWAREMVADELPDATRAALADPRVRVVHGDPRALLAVPSDRPWDAIVVAGDDPDTAAANRLYTVDFYRQARATLAEDGVLLTRVTAGSNFMGDELAAYGGSVRHSLGEVFGIVAAVPGDPVLFCASRAGGPVTLDASRLEARHRTFQGHSPIVAEAFRTLVDPTRVAFVEEVYQRPSPLGGSLRNSDARPLSYTLGLLVQGRFAGSSYVRALRAAQVVGGWLWWIPLAVLLALMLHRYLSGPRRSELAGNLGTWSLAGAGFSAMALGVILLFVFQAKVGTLYGKVGLLSAILLGGVAVGAGLGGWLAALLDPKDAPNTRIPRLPLLVPVFLGGFALVLPPLLSRVGAGDQAEIPLLVLAGTAGLFAGASFPASAVLARGVSGAGGLLFAADHLGGAAAAAIVGVVVLPLHGVDGAAAMVAGVQGLVVALVLLRLAWFRAVAAPSGWSERLARRLQIWQRSLDLRPGFPWPRVGYVLVGVTVSCVAVGALAHHRLDRPKVGFDRTELAVYGGALNHTEEASPFQHYLGRDKGGKLEEVLVATMAVRADIAGYAGPINLLAILGADGVWKRVEILESRETPAYIREVAAWLPEVIGKSIDEPLALTSDGGGIDGVTGATLSARAALATLDSVGLTLSRDVLHRPQTRVATEQGGAIFTAGAVYLLVALLLAPLVLVRGSLRVRAGFLLFNAVAGGLWLNTQISLESLAAPLQGQLPSWRSPQAWLQVFGVGGLTLALGAVYCSAICPFGAVQEWIARLTRPVQLSAEVDRRGRAVKYGVLAVALSCYALSSDRSLFAFDPLALAFAGLPSGWPALVLAVALGGSALVYRFWCRYLCPLGALLSLGNKIAVVGRLLPPRRYRHCDLGVLSVQDMDCLQCNRCCNPADPPRIAGPVQPLFLDRTAVPNQYGERWFSGLIAVAVVAMALSVWSASGGPGARELGAVRDIDLVELQRLIEAGRLSDHEAEFWTSD